MVDESLEPGVERRRSEQVGGREAAAPGLTVGLWKRVRKHKVVEWTLAYVAAAYTLLHGVEMVSAALDWPHFIARLVTLVLFLGLPVATTLAWFHGHRAQHRLSGSELLILTVLLALAGGVLWSLGRPIHEQATTKTAALGPASTVVAPAAVAPTAVARPPEKSVAVLPFLDLSEKKDQEYFSDGLSEELIDMLTKIPELQVIARTSSFYFKGKQTKISEIGRELGVVHILEGSVRRAGNTVRITAQLIDAASGFHLWSQTYDRSLTDILGVQTEVATEVAQQLKVTLVGNEATKLTLGGTRNAEAYDAYLRGEQVARKGNPQEAENRAALAAFDQAIALDPGYALAYAARARTLTSIAMFNAKTVPERERMRRQAVIAAEQAVALAPELGEVHASLAITRAYGRLDFAGAAPEFDRALALAPGNARVQRLFSEFSSALGHHEQALAAARRAVSLDPQNVNVHVSLGRALSHAGRYGEALDAFQSAKVLSPGSDHVESHVNKTLILAGRFDEARERCESPATSLTEASRHVCLAFAYHGIGRRSDAERELDQFMAQHGLDGAYTYASVYATWGDTETALRWLAIAARRHSAALQALRVDRTFDSIRSEPQFMAIQARLKFPP
jgi:adenylate cyclase